MRPTPRDPSLSRALAAFRWVYMPLGLLALIAVGVHAAADAMDDRILWAVDGLDAALDAFFGRWDLTARLVDLVGLEQRLVIARSIALAWELCADLVLALPALGYRERAREPSPLERILEPPKTWRGLLRRVASQPTSMRILRPLSCAAVVLAAACAVARMVQGAVFLPGRPVFGDSMAGLLSRAAAVAALASVLYALGWRAVLQNLEHADQVSAGGPRSFRRALFDGAWGSAIALPLAVLAFLEATPLLSFFR